MQRRPKPCRDAGGGSHRHAAAVPESANELTFGRSRSVAVRTRRDRSVLGNPVSPLRRTRPSLCGDPRDAPGCSVPYLLASADKGLVSVPRLVPDIMTQCTQETTSSLRPVSQASATVYPGCPLLLEQGPAQDPRADQGLPSYPWRPKWNLERLGNLTRHWRWSSRRSRRSG